ncbi:MAG: hypothetical protein IT372_33000 [Polyangiaceae bacterium]|nr:hypothetical protein [Polyangiaceae bacterium]
MSIDEATKLSPGTGVRAGQPDGPGKYNADELDELRNIDIVHASGLTLDEAGLGKVRDLTIKWSDKLREPHISLAWPANLYVPGEADFHQYWFLPPPHENVYQFDWTSSTNPAPTGCTANNGTGYMLSVIHGTNFSGRNRATAGIAMEYKPTATLAQVKVAADINVAGAFRYDFLPAKQGAVGYAHPEFFGTAFLLGWEISPVTGKWEELNNNARRTIFSDTTRYGQQGGQPSTFAASYLGSSFSSKFVVQSGRSYAFGVVFQVTINLDLREADNRTVYHRKANDEIQIWALLSGMMPRITVSTSVVSIP